MGPRAPAPGRAWLTFGLGVTAYAVAAFQRASVGVAGVAAQHRFHTTAAVLSRFSVLQLAVYAGLQIPVGVVLDRIGPRRLVAAGAATMAVGQFGRLGHAWREPGTRLGLWTHFVSQFSGTVFALLWGYPFLVIGEHRTPAEAGVLITLLVVVAMFVGPVLGHLAGRFPYRRSVPVLTILVSTVTIWTVVLAWPGRAPLSLLVVLVVVLASSGPGSLMGFDYARTENEAERIGSATGIVNVGGFVASLITIALIGIVLSSQSRGARRATRSTTSAWRSACSTRSGSSG